MQIEPALEFVPILARKLVNLGQCLALFLVPT